MAITRKINFQINFDYKVMTNYKMIINNLIKNQKHVRI